MGFYHRPSKSREYFSFVTPPSDLKQSWLKMKFQVSYENYTWIPRLISISFVQSMVPEGAKVSKAPFRFFPPVVNSITDLISALARAISGNSYWPTKARRMDLAMDLYI